MKELKQLFVVPPGRDFRYATICYLLFVVAVAKGISIIGVFSNPAEGDEN